MRDYYRELERWEQRQRAKMYLAAAAVVLMIATVAWVFGKMFGVL